MTLPVNEKILVLSTGGTIDKDYFDRITEYQVGEPSVINILKDANLNPQFEFVEVIKKDSLDVNDDDRALMSQAILASDCKKILITHGTDTLVDTAKYLQHAITQRAVVLTGAFKPAIFKSTDASINIGTALGALSVLQEGVYVAISGRVFPADNVKKNYEKNQFEPL